MEPATLPSESQLTKLSYRYFPRREEEKSKFEKGGVRYYFYGQIEPDEYEQRKMREFDTYLAKEKLQLPQDPYFTRQKVLLILSGHGYKPEKTYEAIVAMLQWRKANLPPQLTTKAEEILRSGFLYVCGRDYRMRPILVNNFKVLDANAIEDHVRACVHVNEWVIRNMFLPGQIENWIVIYDLAKMGITDIPISACKQIMKTLSNNYGGRLYRLFAVNVPAAAWLTWKLASTVLDDVTVEKISLDTDIDIPKLFELCDRSQIQKKFGGTQANRVEFWPFQLPEPVVKPQLYISNEEYLKRYKQGRLKNNIIDPEVAAGKV